MGFSLRDASGGEVAAVLGRAAVLKRISERDSTKVT
jgi:hypothetical protein